MKVIDSIQPSDARDRCPTCGADKVTRAMLKPGTFNGYGPLIAICASCRALWEPVHHDLVWDPDDPLCSFAEPCDSCAFRHGSKEQQDRKEWASIKANIEASGGFYCHKGVPIEPGAQHGYAYPHDANGKPERHKLRLCRGWLNAWSIRMDKVAHVRAARQTRRHHCHWPGCDKQVPPAMWGCKAHWFKLPADLRRRIWQTYRKGQEETGRPSRGYLEAAKDVQAWIARHHPPQAEPARLL